MDKTRALVRSRALQVLLIGAVVAVAGGASPAAAAPPAAPTITSSPPSPAALRAPTWSFTGEPGATFECQARRGSMVVQGWSVCTSPMVVDLTGAPDGLYAFEVRAVLGIETGVPASALYELDTTAPPAPVLTGAPPLIGNDPTPSWGFTSGSPDSVAYDSTRTPLPLSMPSIAYSARSTAEVGDVVSLAGSRRHLRAVTATLASWAAHSDFPTYPAGVWTHPITVRIHAVDRSGASPSPGALLASSTRSVDIPWRPEPDPSCPASGPYVGYRGSDGQCHFSVAVNATFDLQGLGVDLPDEVIVSVAFNTQSSGAAPTGVSGPYNMLNLAVVSTGALVGTNVEPDAIFYNSTFAGFYADGGAGGTGTFRRDTGWGSYTPAVQVVTTDRPGPPDALECRVTRGPLVIADWSFCASPATFSLAAAPDGTYTVAVRATDAVGNVGAVASADYTLDRSAPAAPVLTAVPTSPSPRRTPTWAFVGDAATVGLQCRVTGPESRPWAPCASPTTADLDGSPDGTYLFEVRALNGLGTLGIAARHTYELDTTPPPAPTITAAPPSAGIGRSPTWTFSVEPGAGAECQVDRAAVVTIPWQPCSSPFGVDLAAAPVGSYALSVRAIDQAGNRGATTVAGYVLSSASTPGSGGAGGAGGPARPASPGPVVRPATPSAPVAPAARPPLPPVAPVPATPAGGGGPPPSSGGRTPDGGDGGRGSWLSRFLDLIRRAVRDHADDAVFPGSVLLLVGAFLAVQDRIDRKDPKLALAPVYSDPHLTFPPAPGARS